MIREKWENSWGMEMGKYGKRWQLTKNRESPVSLLGNDFLACEVTGNYLYFFLVLLPPINYSYCMYVLAYFSFLHFMLSTSDTGNNLITGHTKPSKTFRCTRPRWDYREENTLNPQSHFHGGKIIDRSIILPFSHRKKPHPLQGKSYLSGGGRTNGFTYLDRLQNYRTRVISKHWLEQINLF